jgi:hypothetical protein
MMWVQGRITSRRAQNDVEAVGCSGRPDAGVQPLAVALQLDIEFPLTLTLSPKEKE